VRKVRSGSGQQANNLQKRDCNRAATTTSLGGLFLAKGCDSIKASKVCQIRKNLHYSSIRWLHLDGYDSSVRGSLPSCPVSWTGDLVLLQTEERAPPGADSMHDTCPSIWSAIYSTDRSAAGKRESGQVIGDGRLAVGSQRCR
jgi:hypothetical protein